MEMAFIEATHGNGAGNWGKFAVGRFTDEEWAVRSALPEAEGQRLIGGRGWSRHHVLAFDLQTGEGALFLPGGFARSDLNKHRIWVCPLFEHFLTWLYEHVSNLADTWFEDLPRVVELPDAPFDMYGYRRPGPKAGVDAVV